MLVELVRTARWTPPQLLTNVEPHDERHRGVPRVRPAQPGWVKVELEPQTH